MATIDEIKKNAQAVKNATQVGENTASRVGGVLSDISDYLNILSKTKNVSLIQSANYDIVNIDTEKKVIVFAPDTIFIIGNDYYHLEEVFSENPEIYQNLKYYDENFKSGANAIVFNIDKTELCAKNFNRIAENDVVIGCVRSLYDTHKFLSASFPFDYTVDGKKIADGAVTENAIADGAVTEKKLSFRDKYDEYKAALSALMVGSNIYENLNDMFEYGNITYNDEDYKTWGYNDNNNRLRMLKNVTIPLKKGCVISLDDYSKANFWLGWYNFDGTTSHTQKWYNKDYVIQEDGNYSILLKEPNSNKLDLEIVKSLHIYQVDPLSYFNDLLFSNTTKTATLIWGNVEPKPNIDTNNMTLNFSKDIVVIADNKQYALKKIHENDGVDYRTIKIFHETSSTCQKLVFNTNTALLYTISWDKKLSIDECLIGVSRAGASTFTDASFPFDYTVDGKIKNYLDIKNIANETYAFNDKEYSVIRAKTDLKFIAHRGFHLNGVPENSLDAYRYAGYLGFDYVETDFCPTADGELVLMHDATINRTMKNKADYTDIVDSVQVIDKTLNELRNDYVLSAEDKRMRREIPTLEEFFVTCKNSGVFPIPEIKATGTTKEHVKKAFELGQKILGEENFGFCSFSYSLLDYARSLSNKVKLCYIGSSILGTTNSVTGASRESYNTCWYPSYTDVTKEVVSEYRKRGIEIAVWTTPVSKFDDMLKIGVNILAGDYLGPNINGLSGLVFNSNNDFSDFTTNGNVENSVVKLSAGQNIAYYNTVNNWVSSYFLSVIGKGHFRIDSNNLSVEVNNNMSNRYVYQGLINNNTPNIKITAISDSEIEFIDFCVAKFYE